MTVSSKSSLVRKGLTALAVAGALATASAAGVSSAQAHVLLPVVAPNLFFHHHHHHHGDWGPGLGVGVGLGLLGAAIADSGPTCYWQREYNRYGDYLGRVRVCE